MHRDVECGPGGRSGTPAGVLGRHGGATASRSAPAKRRLLLLRALAIAVVRRRRQSGQRLSPARVRRQDPPLHAHSDRPCPDCVVGRAKPGVGTVFRRRRSDRADARRARTRRGHRRHVVSVPTSRLRRRVVLGSGRPVLLLSPGAGLHDGRVGRTGRLGCGAWLVHPLVSREGAVDGARAVNGCRRGLHVALGDDTRGTHARAMGRARAAGRPDGRDSVAERARSRCCRPSSGRSRRSATGDRSRAGNCWWTCAMACCLSRWPSLDCCRNCSPGKRSTAPGSRSLRSARRFASGIRIGTRCSGRRATACLRCLRSCMSAPWIAAAVASGSAGHRGGA